jgi:glutamate-1-semialdehyde 2,1-aminomutase
MFSRFYRKLLQQGIYFPPSQYETGFLSCAHDEDDIEKTISAIEKAFEAL